MFFKVTFNLDGSGLIYDPNEPIHLDALIHWCLVPFHRTKSGLSRSDIPDEIPLPLCKKMICDSWVWQASALFPEGKEMESLQYWRKRFRQNRIELISGSPNLQNGPYREWNMPIPKIHCLKMVAYANGNRKEVKRLLKNIKFLGKKRAYGHGRIISIDTEEMQENFSLIKDGCSMRWLPDANGIRLVRPRPPYWNINGAINCCEVGDGFSIS